MDEMDQEWWLMRDSIVGNTDSTKAILEMKGRKPVEKKQFKQNKKDFFIYWMVGWFAIFGISII